MQGMCVFAHVVNQIVLFSEHFNFFPEQTKFLKSLTLPDMAYFHNAELWGGQVVPPSVVYDTICMKLGEHTRPN